MNSMGVFETLIFFALAFPFLINTNHSFSKTDTGCCIIFLSNTEFIIWNVSTDVYCSNTQLYCCRIFVTKL
jgi:hypothetical protein